MRRILIVPSVSSTSVADSEPLQELYALTEAVAGFGEKAYFYMVVPPWVRDGLRGHQRLHYVHMETTRDEAINDVVGYSAVDMSTLFARRGGRYVIDAVITDCVQFSLQLSRMLSDPVRERMPVIVRDLRRVYENKDEVEDNASVALGYASNYFAYTSPDHQKDVLGFLRTYLQASMLRRFTNRSLSWPMSFDLERIDKLNTLKKRKNVTVCFGGDPSQKRSRTVFSVYRKLYGIGIDIVVASRESRAMLKRSLPDDDTSYLAEINCSLAQDAYLTELAKSHMFVSVSEGEGANWEDVRKILLGQVGVFPYRQDGVLSRLLGEEYPFYYNVGREDEAVELAAWIAANYDDARSRIAPVVERCRSLFERKAVLRQAWGKITNIIDEGYRTHTFEEKEEAGKKLSLQGSLKKVATGLGNEFALQVFFDILEEHATWLKPWGHKGTLQTLGRVHESLPTLYDLRELLDNLGWKDTCLGHEPMMKKV